MNVAIKKQTNIVKGMDLYKKTLILDIFLASVTQNGGERLKAYGLKS